MITRRAFLNLSSSFILANIFLPKTVFSGSNGIYDDNAHKKLIHLIKSKSKKTTLKILYPKGSIGNLIKTIHSFEKLFGIKITAIEASLDNIASEMVLSHKFKDTSYDIALPATFNIPNLVEANIIADLTDIAKEYEPASLFDNSLYRVGDFHNSRLYGYQTDGDAYMMFYNKHFLDDVENNKRYEDTFGKELLPPVTWDELDQQIQFFHQPDKKQYGGSLFRNKEYIAWEFWVRLHSLGLYPVNDDMESNLNSPEAISAIDEMIAINGYLEPSVKKNGLFENFKSFSEGNKYCNIGWGGTQKYLYDQNSVLKDNTLFSPTLGRRINDKETYTPFFNWGWNYVVAKNSNNKELAYLFCLFASTPQVSIESIREASGYFDPYREEHYNDSKIISIYGESFLKQHRFSLINSIPDFYLRGQNLYFNVLKQGLFAASQGQFSTTLALNNVAKKWEQITDELGRKEQINQWLNLKKQYPDNFKKLVSQ